MGSCDGAEICELVDIYILSRLSTIIDKKDCGLYRDDGLLVRRNVSEQQIDRFRKTVIQIFKEIGFLIDIETNLNIVSLYGSFMWFNQPFSRNISTNVAKKFPQLLHKHFPPSNSLHKIFDRNTIKLRYCCTQNLGKTIKSHNKKLIFLIIRYYHARRREKKCPFEGKCRANYVVYKCIASATSFPIKFI